MDLSRPHVNRLFPEFIALPHSRDKSQNTRKFKASSVSFYNDTQIELVPQEGMNRCFGKVKGLVELAVGARRDLPTGHVLESGLAECACSLISCAEYD